MRAFLVVSVVLTVAVAWAAGASTEPLGRAGPAVPVHLEDAKVGSETPEAASPAQPPVHVEVSAGGDTWASAEADELGDSWIPLELAVVDGETGAREAARESGVLAESRSEGFEWRSSTHVRRGDRVTALATVTAAPGHVPDDGGSYRASGYVSRRAGRVRMLAPLRREADVRLRVLDAAGRPAAGAKLGIVTLAGDEPRLSHEGPFDGSISENVGGGPGLAVACSAASADAEGWMRVHGVPHLMDERFWVAAGTEGHENYTELRLVAAGIAHVAEIRLPEQRAWVWQAETGVGGRGCGGSRSLRTHCGRYVPARLEAVVFRRDGLPATSVVVTLGGDHRWTDESGRVVFEGLRPGTYDLDARDPDFVWSKASVELRDGESRIVEILEPPGWTARATLLDSMGRRVPFARVGVSSRAPVAYVRVEGGVQDLVLYTDANGEIEVPRLHHAPATLRFDYGSRHESVTVEEGDPHATVRLPPP